jgi:hypothetical protein
MKKDRVGWNKARILEIENTAGIGNTRIRSIRHVNQTNEQTQFGYFSHMGLPYQQWS